MKKEEDGEREREGKLERNKPDRSCFDLEGIRIIVGFVRSIHCMNKHLFMKTFPLSLSREHPEFRPSHSADFNYYLIVVIIHRAKALSFMLELSPTGETYALVESRGCSLRPSPSPLKVCQLLGLSSLPRSAVSAPAAAAICAPYPMSASPGFSFEIASSHCYARMRLSEPRGRL